jgi:hypothetical protein
VVIAHVLYTKRPERFCRTSCKQPEPSVSSIAIYQLRVVLCGVSPLVWRRLLVVSTTSIAELHEILQNAFSWSGEHLHRLERALPFDPNRTLPSCIGGSRAAPPEDCAGAWDYLERMDRHKYQPPIEELGIMAEAMQRFLDSDGDRRAIGDLDELREAVDRVKAYQDFQPGKFDRRELNRQLRALAQDREVRR